MVAPLKRWEDWEPSSIKEWKLGSTSAKGDPGSVDSTSWACFITMFFSTLPNACFNSSEEQLPWRVLVEMLIWFPLARSKCIIKISDNFYAEIWISISLQFFTGPIWKINFHLTLKTLQTNNIIVKFHSHLEQARLTVQAESRKDFPVSRLRQWGDCHGWFI